MGYKVLYVQTFIPFKTLYVTILESSILLT